MLCMQSQSEEAKQNCLLEQEAVSFVTAWRDNFLKVVEKVVPVGRATSIYQLLLPPGCFHLVASSISSSRPRVLCLLIPTNKTNK